MVSFASQVTILPSHVDPGNSTDYADYGQPLFGLIYSCFRRNQDLTQRIQVTAFQSISDESGSIDGIQ
ncbi:hypothetical protein BSLG_005768 [Batrachochytrium salamandrivorans]|nr:hypothetical protein BSLG_005768 [Batrachochytrium salamandrivorans]